VYNPFGRKSLLQSPSSRGTCIPTTFSRSRRNPAAIPPEEHRRDASFHDLPVLVHNKDFLPQQAAGIFLCCEQISCRLVDAALGGFVLGEERRFDGVERLFKFTVVIFCF
jgi:hypothetical protein